MPAGRGFADLVFLPLPSVRKPALVVELKYDKTAYAAIQQIRDRAYAEALKGYAGEVLLVGINYEKKRKRHSCVIGKTKLNGLDTEEKDDGNCTGIIGGREGG